MAVFVSTVIGARVFPMTYYGAWIMQFTKAPATNYMYLVSSSPADSIIGATDMANVISAWETAVAGLSGVSGSPSVTAITPSMATSGTSPVAPWLYGGSPTLSFDSAWTLAAVGYEDSGTPPASGQMYLAGWVAVAASAMNITEFDSVADAITTAVAAVSGISSAARADQTVFSPSTVQ